MRSDGHNVGADDDGDDEEDEEEDEEEDDDAIAAAAAAAAAAAEAEAADLADGKLVMMAEVSEVDGRFERARLRAADLEDDEEDDDDEPVMMVSSSPPPLPPAAPKPLAALFALCAFPATFDDEDNIDEIDDDVDEDEEAAPETSAFAVVVGTVEWRIENELGTRRSSGS